MMDDYLTPLKPLTLFDENPFT